MNNYNNHYCPFCVTGTRYPNRLAAPTLSDGSKQRKWKTQQQYEFYICLLLMTQVYFGHGNSKQYLVPIPTQPCELDSTLTISHSRRPPLPRQFVGGQGRVSRVRGVTWYCLSCPLISRLDCLSTCSVMAWATR